MTRPNTANLDAWIIGNKLTTMQKADAVIEYNKLNIYLSHLESIERMYNLNKNL